VAVVSGASSGLGRRLASGLARAGALVVVVGRRKDVLLELADELGALTPGARAAPCDVRDTEAWTGLLAEVEDTHGRVDILVNNAGTDPGIRLSEIDLDDFRRTFEVNFVAPVAGTLVVLPGMRARSHGIIANVSSDGGRLPSPGPGAYPASKAALSAFTESVSFRVERDGVHMHVVYPAWMPTSMGLGALQRGLRHPPRFTRRTEDEVADIVLARMGGPRLEISASRLIDAATVFRAMAPGPYHRLRRTW
jgi:NAD(P)-dependent dehydrogenase (short-subunit alcohol dehydrogenase family)